MNILNSSKWIVLSSASPCYGKASITLNSLSAGIDGINYSNSGSAGVIFYNYISYAAYVDSLTVVPWSCYLAQTR